MFFWARIVGDDDGGKLFTPEEYEAYKKKVLPMVSMAQHSQQLSALCRNVICSTARARFERSTFYIGRLTTSSKYALTALQLISPKQVMFDTPTACTHSTVFITINLVLFICLIFYSVLKDVAWRAAL